MGEEEEFDEAATAAAGWVEEGADRLMVDAAAAGESAREAAAAVDFVGVFWLVLAAGVVVLSRFDPDAGGPAVEGERARLRWTGESTTDEPPSTDPESPPPPAASDIEASSSSPSSSSSAVGGAVVWWLCALLPSLAARSAARLARIFILAACRFSAAVSEREGAAAAAASGFLGISSWLLDGSVGRWV